MKLFFPCIPGKSLTVAVVDYAPAGEAPSHADATSAFIYGYVVAGAIESQVNGGPKRMYQTGESFFGESDAVHRVNRNASGITPAKLLTVLMVDTDDKVLTVRAE
jgi:quercetin dioxygenase-like cupin family protein